MAFEGGCYCKAVRYRADGDPILKAQCHCRECQYITGGHPLVGMGVPGDTFQYTQGEPSTFTRSDIDSPVTREFCPTCGTHLTTTGAPLGGMVLIKVGTLDDPSVFEGPQMAIYTCDKQPFHHVPEGIPTFDKAPG